MKTTLKRILTALLAMALLPVLPSCAGEKLAASRLMAMDETERGYALYEMLSAGLRDTESFTITTEMEFSSRVEGQTYRITAQSFLVSIDQNGAGCTDYYEDVYTVVHGDAYGESSVYRSTSGYADGYIFRSYEESEGKDGGWSVAGKSPLPCEEYIEEYVPFSESELLGIQAWTCGSVTCEKQEDGSFHAVFGELDEAGLGEVDGMFGIDLSYVNPYAMLHSAEVAVTTTPDLLLNTVTVTLYYGEGNWMDGVADRSYAVVYEQTFSYEPPVMEKLLDLSLYDDMGDLTVADDFFYYLDERLYADEGAFNTKIRMAITADGEAQVTTSRCEGSYKTRGGLFSYEDKGVYEDGEESFESSTVYEDGTLIYSITDPETGEVHSDSYAFTEEEVRLMLWSEICYEDLLSDSVIRIETLDAAAGKYRLHFGGAVEEAYRDYYREYKGSMRSFAAWADVTMSEDGLISYEYHAKAEGFTEETESETYEVEFSCIFKEMLDKPESI